MRFFGAIKNNRGFTLIELLVVIAIIGLLASIVLVSLNSASRMKARDVRKIADFKNIQTALYMFYDQFGRMPNNYYPGYGVCEGSPYYN